MNYQEGGTIHADKGYAGYAAVHHAAVVLLYRKAVQGTAGIDDVMKLLGEMTEALDEFDTLLIDEAVEQIINMFMRTKNNNEFIEMIKKVKIV